MADEIRITRLGWSGNICRLTITGLEEPLIVTAELAHRHRLKQGIVLTPPQLKQLIEEAERARCEQSVGRMLAMREHTTGELRVKLIQRRFASDVIEETLAKYHRLGLLDDARVAFELARQAYKRKPSGRSFLLAYLASKRVERMLAERTVDRLLADVDELEAAVAALKQKWSQPDQIEVETVRTRAYSYLSRRGFGYETARAAVSQCFESTGKADQD